MPKPVKKKRTPPRDVNQLARFLVDSTTESEPPKVTKDEVSRVMASLGRRGGKVSGARRMKNLSAEQRSTIALNAATIRWKKARDKQRKG